jgi:hypothetical protein
MGRSFNWSDRAPYALPIAPDANDGREISPDLSEEAGKPKVDPMAKV